MTKPVEYAVDAIRAAPPAAYVVAYLSSIPISTWVSFATLVYLVVQIVVIIRRERRDSRAQRIEEPSE